MCCICTQKKFVAPWWASNSLRWHSWWGEVNRSKGPCGGHWTAGGAAYSAGALDQQLARAKRETSPPKLCHFVGRDAAPEHGDRQTILSLSWMATAAACRWPEVECTVHLLSLWRDAQIAALTLVATVRARYQCGRPSWSNRRVRLGLADRTITFVEHLQDVGVLWLRDGGLGVLPPDVWPEGCCDAGNPPLHPTAPLDRDWERKPYLLVFPVIVRCLQHSDNDQGCVYKAIMDGGRVCAWRCSPYFSICIYPYNSSLWL